MAENTRRKKPSDYQVGIDHGKVPPNSTDLEELLLGGLLLHCKKFYLIADILNPEDFYKLEHQAIFEAMMEEDRRNAKFDMVTISKNLKSNGKLELVGGAYYVSQLTDRVASSENAELWARIIKQDFLKREVIRVSGEMYHRGFEDTSDALELINELAIESLRLNSQLNVNQKSIKVFDASYKMNDQIRQRKADGVDGRGHRSGFPELDAYTGGWVGGRLITIAARPGMGKTALGICASLNTAQLGTPVAFFSLEMSTDELVKRAQSVWFKFPHDSIMNEKLEGYQMNEMDNNQHFQKLPLYITDTPNMDIKNLRAKIIEQVRDYGVKVVFVDYIGLVRGSDPDRPKEGHNFQVGYYTKILKGLAKEFDVCVVIFAQLNRKVEDRGGKKIPRLSDLKDSGDIEQDSDQVIFCYRPSEYGIKQTDPIGANRAVFTTEGTGQLLMQKNRHGKKGNFIMIFDGAYMTWREPSPEELAEKKISEDGAPIMTSSPAPAPPLDDLKDDEEVF